MPLRIIFMGTPDFSVPSLAALAEAGHEIIACYSQPPRPAGRRGLELKKSPVHTKAEALGIRVFTPENFKTDEEQENFKALNADVAIVIAYGLLLPKTILDAPRLGCYNGHASLLPRWRGAAPLQRAIMAGDEETGVNIMKMDVGLDTGPVALSQTLPISENMTAGELHDALSQVTAELMVETASQLEGDKIVLKEQSVEGVLYASKIEKSECRIDWSKPAPDVHNHIRGLSPFPGAWCEMQLGGKLQRVKVLNSQLGEGKGEAGKVLEDLTIYCGKGAVKLTRVQRAGKQAQSAEEFLRGNKVEAVL
jgi:methionyl-tRNA formyltransferase